MKPVILLFCFLHFAKGISQPDTALQKPVKTENYISLYYDNDFFSATDRYYTQGVMFSFIHPAVRYSPFSHTLLKLKQATLNYYGLKAEQDVFTPVSIRHAGVFYNERPFSAVFFVSHARTSICSQNHLLLHSSLDLGIIGPAAKGEEEQKAIHKVLNNIQPLGWENQLSNDAVINYNVAIEKAIWNKKYAELMARANIRAGTLYDDVAAGLYARAGIAEPYFSSLGNRAHTGRGKFKIWLHASAQARLVVYNATLQGGVFSQSIYTLPAATVSRLVFNGEGGISLAFMRVRITYSRFYITPEFRQGVDHGWGRCIIALSF